MKIQIAILNADDIPKALPKTKYAWGELEGSTRVYPCHAAQLDVLGSKAKITAAVAGAQGGKTAIISLWLFKRASALEGKANFLVVSPTYKVLQQSRLVEMVEETFGGTPYGGRYKKQEATYEWSGGRILFRSVDNPQNLDAGVYDGVVVDEAAKVPNEAWERLKVRAAAKDAPILLVSTPDLDNFLADVEQQTNAIGGDEDKRRSDDGRIYLRRWKSIDRPGFSVQAYDDAKRTMSPAMFDRMFNGVYSQLEGLCYGLFSDDKSAAYPVIKADPLKGLPSRPVRFVGGNDWGFGDASSILLAAECEDGCIYVVEEIYVRGKSPDELAPLVQALLDRWIPRVDEQYRSIVGGSFVGFYSDTSRPEIKKWFNKLGIPVRGKLVDDITAGIAITDSWFNAGRLKIFANCSNLIRELRGYRWDTTRAGDIKDKPKGGNDHAADALRYLISSHKKDQRLTPVETKAIDPEAERAKLERHGISEAHLKEHAEAEGKERYARWFAWAVNLESGE